MHGSLVSLADLVHLMPGRASESEIEDAIRSHPALNSRFALQSGYVVDKRTDANLESLVLAEKVSRDRASANLSHARHFVPLLKSARFEMVGVSGSTSYYSASRSKDLDLFCVSPAGTMWPALSKALLLSRAFSMVRKGGPPICLSCVMDERFAQRAFSIDQGGLFARDALQLIVLAGDPTYRSILTQAGWMSVIYPAAYARRLNPAVPTPRTRRSSPWASAMNRFLFVLVGSYIRVKSYALNRRLSSQGKSDSLFAVRLGEDHLIYESKRYAKLRRRYTPSSDERTAPVPRASEGRD